MIKRFFNKLLIGFCVLLFVFALCDYAYPYETRQFINYISGKVESISSDCVVQLYEMNDNGLYTLQTKVNGVDMEFILDTGCSDMLMSRVEFQYLKKIGALSERDYIGETSSTDADGDVSVCRMYNIKRLEVGGHVIKDVQCGVSDSEDAYMLLGQSVLSNFTTVTIDYSTNTLKLEK